LLDQKIMNANFLGRALRAPFAPIVLEVADELLLLGVDRDHRLVGGERGAHLFIEVRKLRVSILVIRALARLAVGLQAVAQLLKDLPDHAMADLMPELPQLVGQPAQALASPAQRRHRIAALVWR